MHYALKCNKKLGFTLIELLTVIILLGVLSAIVVPVTLNVIGNSKERAYDEQIKSLLRIAEQYGTMNDLGYDSNSKRLTFQELKEAGLLQDENVINPKTSKPLEGCILYKWSNNQYEYRYDSNCEITETIPTITVKNNNGVFTNGWSKNDFYIGIKTTGNKYEYCICDKECIPNIEVREQEGSALISNEGNNVVCAKGIGTTLSSEVVCSEIYKLDKTKPQFSGINDVTIQKNASIDLRSGVTVSDTTSGVDGIFTIDPTSVDTSKAGTTNVTYTVSDLAGNIQTITRKIIVDTLAPTATFTVQGSPINGNGWSKNDFYVKVDINDQSGLGIKEAKWCSTQSNTCTPNAIMSGASMTPLISTQSNNNRICIQATDKNNKTSEVICSDAYKLDKTIPTAGTATFSGTIGSNSWYTSNVTVNTSNGSDSLSGHSSTNSNITSITSNTSGTTITITTTDLAGNQSTRTYTVKVDKNAPTLTAKTDSVTITQGDSINTSTYFNSPSYSISGGSMSCSPSNTSSMAVGNQTITCTATGNNGLKAITTKTITVNTSQTYLLNIVKNMVYANNTCKTDETTYIYENYCCIKGLSNNNYLRYKGILWRIMGIYSGRIKLISADNYTQMAFHSNSTDFNNSYIRSWLYDEFMSETGINDSNLPTIISVDEYTLAGYSNSYLKNGQSFWTSTPMYGDTIGYVIVSSGDAIDENVANKSGVRPIIFIDDIPVTEIDGILVAN